MTVIHIVAGTGVFAGFVLIAAGISGVGVGRWWGTGRMGRTRAVIMGAAFAVFNLEWVLTLTDAQRIGMSFGALSLMITVMLARRRSME